MWFRAFRAPVVVCAALAVSVAQAAELRVVVKDDGGMPVDGVEILVRSPSGAQLASLVTDAGGLASFHGLNPGIVDVVASHPDYERVSVRGISLSSVSEDELRLVLVHETVVVVQDGRVIDVDTAANTHTVSGAAMDEGAFGGDIFGTFKTIPGIGPTGGGNVPMLGAGPNDNTWMIDGVVVSDPVTNTFGQNFNYQASDGVEVLMSGYDAENGAALGGVINVLTRSGTNDLDVEVFGRTTNGNWSPRMDGRFTSDGYRLAPSDFDATFHTVMVGGRLSGPIVRDRLFALVSTQHRRSIITNSGALQPRDFDSVDLMSKLTWAPTNDHRVDLTYHIDPTTVDNTLQADPFVRAEAQGRQSQGNSIGIARWQWFPSNRVVTDVRATVQQGWLQGTSVPCTHDRDLGYHPCRPGEQEGYLDLETPGRIGVSGAYSSANAYLYSFDERGRAAATAHLSVSDLDFLGSHRVKVGMEVERTTWEQVRGFTGNVVYFDLNVDPSDPATFENLVFIETSGPVRFQTTGNRVSGFVQDVYQPVRSLTLRPGVRFDHAVSRNDLGEAVIRGTTISPRTYFAWDPSGEGKSRISGGYGRFADVSRLALSDFTSVSGFGTKTFDGEYYASGTGGFLSSSDHLQDVSPVDNPNQAWDRLRIPRADELLLTVERQIAKGTALSVTWTGRSTRGLYEPDEVDLIVDEDGSAVIGSRDADPLFGVLRLRTPLLARRTLHQGTIVLRKVDDGAFYGQLAYTATIARGTTPASVSGAFANDPQSQYAYGRLPQDVRHVISGYGAVRFDKTGTTVGLVCAAASGAPLERLYYSEEARGYALRIQPRGGSRTFGGTVSVDTRITQGVHVGRGRLVADLEVHNALGLRAPDAVSALYDQEERLLAVSRQDPMRLLVGLRYIR